MTRPAPIPAEPGRIVAAIFAGLWAAAVCFHVGSYGIWERSIYATLAAVWLLGKPSSAPRLLLLAATIVSDVWLYLPEIPNHWIIHGFVAAAVLVAYGAVAWTRRTFVVDAASIYAASAPAIRLSVAVLYFWVVFHKINVDYLFSPVSCGAEFYREQRTVFGFFPEGRFFEMTSAYLTLLIETAIPLLLLFVRTRAWGVLLGVAFHVFIAFNPISGFYNFSALLFALYACFIPETLLVRIATELSDVLARLRRQFGGFARWKLLVTLLIGVATVYLLAHEHTQLGSRRTFLILWTPYGLLGAWVALRLVAWDRAAHPAPEPVSLRPAYAVLWLVPLAVLLNGVTPYLGLKTENSFSMYSNLRTEGGVSNHLLLPSTQVFGYQHDLVDIVDASVPPLKRVRDAGELLPFFELRRVLAQQPDRALRYRRGQDAGARTDAAEQSGTGARAGYVLRKLLRFRPVEPPGAQPCVH